MAGTWTSGRRETTTKLNDLLSLDVRILARKGGLVPGLYTFTWSSINYNDKCSLGIETRKDDLILKYQTAQERVRQLVPLEWRACHLGGERAYFRCPVCDKRVCILYFNQARFKCKECTGLIYRCQIEGHADRMLRRSKKIRKRLKAHPMIGAPTPKPKWMRWATYFPLWTELIDCEKAALAPLAKRFQK